MDSYNYSYSIPMVNNLLNQQPKQPKEYIEFSDCDSVFSLGSDKPVCYAPFSLEEDNQAVVRYNKSCFDSHDEECSTDDGNMDYKEKMSNQDYASLEPKKEVKHDPHKYLVPKRRGRPPLSPKTKYMRTMAKHKLSKRPRGRPPITDSIKALQSHNASGERRRGRPMKPTNLRILQHMSRGNFDFLGPVTPNNGFTRGLILKKIICAFKRSEKLHFLVKFKRCAEFEVVTNEELKELAPDVLIQYYDTHLDTTTAKADSDSD